MEDFGFESCGVIDFNCGYIKLKLSFRKDDGVNREKRTVRERFDRCTISTNVNLFTKFWVIG
jgi:hypothetical protein